METVCVTGASGFLASWLVKLLLQRGYTVKATVRDLTDPRKTSHLLALDGAKDRLQLFEADLLDEGSFDTAIDGCVAVFHTASPFHDVQNDPQVELVDPAVKGTLNVLSSCAKTPAVRRVVLTSSVAAVALNEKSLAPDVVIDETWWSSVDLCRELKQWYCLAKTLAEEAAWEFAKEKGIDMVALAPANIVGPLLQLTLNTSSSWILNLVNGSETYPNVTFGWVDVRDLANAHILAFENSSASGRCLVAGKVVHQSEIVKILHELYPGLKLPEKCADDKPFAAKFQISQEKAKEIGIKFRPLEQSIKEAVESFGEKGLCDFSAAL